MRKTRGILTRRDFGRMSAAVLAAPLVGFGSNDSPASMFRESPTPRSPVGESAQRFNILFIFGDQERYFPKWPAGLSLPGHERLQQTGITFENHYTSAIMCTPSRSVLLTGLQTPDTRMFDNTDMPWVKNLSTDVPTIGQMLRKAGYYTAYKGKWHLNKEFDSQDAERLFTKEMEAYGFSDYAGPAI